MAIVISTSFAGPPLNLSSSQIGLMSLGPCAGIVVGFLICTLISDWSVKLMVKRNNGIYEPEFRFILTVPQAITGFVGLYGFGVVASDTQKYGWFWPAFFYALQVSSLVIGTTVGSCYIIDGYSKFLSAWSLLANINRRHCHRGIYPLHYY